MGRLGKSIQSSGTRIHEKRLYIFTRVTRNAPRRGQELACACGRGQDIELRTLRTLKPTPRPIQFICLQRNRCNDSRSVTINSPERICLFPFNPIAYPGLQVVPSFYPTRTFLPMSAKLPAIKITVFRSCIFTSSFLWGLAGDQHSATYDIHMVPLT